MATVYALTCIEEDKAYIGCTRSNLAKRFREHRCLLRAGRHTCRALQTAWIRFEGAFVMQAIATCGDELAERRAAELEAMQAHASRLYNEEQNSFQPTEEAIRKGVAEAVKVEGRKHSPEANEKRRMAQLGKPKGHGAKISATKQARKAQQVMR